MLLIVLCPSFKFPFLDHCAIVWILWSVNTTPAFGKVSEQNEMKNRKFQLCVDNPVREDDVYQYPKTIMSMTSIMETLIIRITNNKMYISTSICLHPASPNRRQHEYSSLPRGPPHGGGGTKVLSEASLDNIGKVINKVSWDSSNEMTTLH